MRLPSPLRIVLVAGILAVALPGCRGWKLFTPGDDKPGDGGHDGHVASSVSKPSRYSFRIAPYVFLSDFEIDRNLPLFRELANLRDQVYKELQLPSTDRPVLEHLFEDRER